MVTVLGGTMPSTSALAGQKVAPFQIQNLEVSYEQWQTVAWWATAYTFDSWPVYLLGGDKLPARRVAWNDAVKWCNAKSEMEGLEPVYTLDGQVFRSGNPAREEFARVVMNRNATGYRLPTELEWEWAARGGAASQSYAYSGGNDAATVAWHSANSSGAPQLVGTRSPNELSLYDMSGNVDEWLWDFGYNFARTYRGGSFSAPATGSALSNRGDYDSPTQTVVPTIGIRLVRLSGTPVNIHKTLAFGSVLVGQELTLGLIIQNNSPTSDLTVSSMVLPTGYRGSWTGTLGPSESREVPITFTPLESKSYIGAIDIQWSAGGGGAAVLLSGTGVGTPSGMVYVAGGTLPTNSPLGARAVPTMLAKRTEVTWAEWETVKLWGATNGYNLQAFITGYTVGPLPARGIERQFAAAWCNAKSQMEGLVPAYYDSGFDWAVWKGPVAGGKAVLNTNANGYRLPMEAEWEWAARGGVQSLGTRYSGGANPDDVAWHYSNTGFGAGPKDVGLKLPNELGIFDMSGNVVEICDNMFGADGALFQGFAARGGSYATGPTATAITNRFKVDGSDLDNRHRSEVGFRPFMLSTAGESRTNMIEVPAGRLYSSSMGSPLGEVQVARFYMGQYEVTWSDWETIRSWGQSNGYAFSNQGDSRQKDIESGGLPGVYGEFPVEHISWYDAVAWCNAKSEKEGLQPVYRDLSNNIHRGSNVVPVVNSSANGYRLPTEVEWEYAARGATRDVAGNYSGGTIPDYVAWYLDNNNTKPGGSGSGATGTRLPNELGIYDMSGNVAEWCWDPHLSAGDARRFRGGTWGRPANEATVTFRSSATPTFAYQGYGFRVVRSTLE